MKLLKTVSQEIWVRRNKISKLNEELKKLYDICTHENTEQKEIYYPSCYDHTGYTEYWIQCKDCGKHLKTWSNY